MNNISLRLVLIQTALASALVAREIPIVPPAEAALDEAKLSEIDRFMEGQVADQKLAGAVVMISHAGKIGFFRAYGLQNREAQIPMSTNTICRIYSMTKAITCAAALSLYDAGKLGLDDPVSKYIPSFANLQVAATNGLRSAARP